MTDQDYYYQCVIGLIKLHGLDLLGINDSIEADDIRDATDKLFYLLSADYISELKVMFKMLYEAIDRYKGNNPIP